MATLGNGDVAEVKDRPNGHIHHSEKSDRRRSPIRWALGLVVRLCIWYAVLTPFFHCPSHLSELTDSSPRVCKPYLIARSRIEPRIRPYYDSYAAPYVDLARPYAQSFNEHVYSPAAKVVRNGYDTYGAPAIEQAREYSQTQWREQVVPRLHTARDSAKEIYTAKVDPHIKKAKAVVEPYYSTVSGKVVQIQKTYILPTYAQARPFIGKTYSSGQNILTTTVLPFAQRSWSGAVLFASTEVWPRVTGVYSENVEPQLVKIGQKLASYREGRKLRAVVDEVESSIDEPATSTVSPSFETSRDSKTATHSSTSEAAPTATTTKLTPSQQIEQAREKIASDLRTWQEKFAVAADKGVEDLEERIQEIVESQIKSGAREHGESLVIALKTVADHELATVRERINSIVESLPTEEAPRDEETAQGELLRQIRSAGLSIRDRAHALREWYNSFDNELTRRVTTAVDSTLEILDGIRDLGLQEIGMRWAWMDGVTYKDWSKYHALKARFEDWRNEVRDVGMQHDKIEKARAIANDILSQGMAITEDAANELTRLKEVGKWKIEARDVSDNFDIRTEPPPRPKPRASGEQTSNEEATPLEETESFSETAAQDSEPSSAMPSTEADDRVESDESVSEEEPSATDSYTPSETPENLTVLDDAEAPDQIAANRVWGGASAQAVTEQAPLFKDVSDDEKSRISERASSLASQAATTASSAVAEPLQSISSIASSRLQEALSIASEQYENVKATISPTPPLGQNPILLDAERRYHEAVGHAHDRYSAFVDSASQAVFASPAPTAAPESSHNPLDAAKSQYSQASSLASSSLTAVVASASSAMPSMGKGTAQDIIEDASSRYSAAISAASASLSSASASASSAVYGTPTRPLESATVQASENLDKLISKASEQVYGTPTPYVQQILDQPMAQYEALKGLVSDLLVGKEPEYTESVMSRFRAAYETPYPSSGSSSASRYASDAYETASSIASAHAAPLPSIEDVLHSANKQLNSAVDAASAYALGSSKGTYEQATSAAANAYASASSQFEDAYSSARSFLSSAVSGSATPAATNNGALESATSRLAVAVESAQARLRDLAPDVGDYASEFVPAASSATESPESGVTGSTSSETKDEL